MRLKGIDEAATKVLRLQQLKKFKLLTLYLAINKEITISCIMITEYGIEAKSNSKIISELGGRCYTYKHKILKL